MHVTAEAGPSVGRHVPLCKEVVSLLSPCQLLPWDSQ